MYLDKNSLICGYPASVIRRIFQRLQCRHVYIHYFSYNLKIKKAAANKLVNALIAEGYLKSESSNRGNTFSATVKGNSLAMASFAPPISRRTAEKKISELLDRVKIVNTSDNFLYKVKRVAVFGSYLTDKEKINDIDVDIILKEKYPHEIQLAKEKACVQKAFEEGKEFRSHFEQLFYAHSLTRKFLKHRSRALSLHYGDDILKQTEYKVIYELADECTGRSTTLE
jgi:predicted nucleotidyltransferase/predicted transcriptional regulator